MGEPAARGAELAVRCLGADASGHDRGVGPSALLGAGVHRFHREPHAERALLVYGQAEAVLTPLMETLEARHPGVRVFSLPSVGDAHTRRHIELGVKGAPEQVDAAWSDMCAALERMGMETTPLTGPLQGVNTPAN